jgi:hypothetical protein
MKLNFRKVSALASSALMIGMTAGIAAAANYPAPFVSGGSPNVAIVYGSGAAFSDQTAASSIAESLSSYVGGGGTPTGGDSFKLERTSTFFHLGDNVTQVYSSDIDDDELEELLADGTYIDDDNDEFDFTQKITIGSNLQLSMFEDNDYIEDEPTVGFRIPSGTNVMTYTLTMTDQPLLVDLTTTDITIMGKNYYVLSNSSSGSNFILTLLDSAEDTTLTEGETATVSGHTVSVDYISSSEVVLIVDGVATNGLGEADTQKLSDGSYIGIKDIRFNSKEGTTSSVEFSIGTGKLKLTSGSDVEINDDVVNGLSSTITNTTTALTSIAIAWAADDDLFVTPTSTITMPGFEAVKFSFGGLNYPAEEEILVERGSSTHVELSNFPLKDTTADIPFLYGASAGNFTGIGKDANSRLITGAVGSNITFDADTDDMFVATWNSSSEAESYLIRVTNFITDSGTDKADFQYLKDGTWETFQTKAQHGDTFSLGSVDLQISWVNNSNNNVSIVNSTSGINFNQIYSKEGLKVQLPYEVTNASALNEGVLNKSATSGGYDVGNPGHWATNFYLVAREEDKDDNLGSGDWINLTIGWDSGSTSQPEVSAINTANADATSTEIGETDVFRDLTYSALATEILYEQPSSGQKSAKLMYHGSEVKADVYITAPEAVLSGGGSLGDVLVTDSEVSSVSSKNLIVVGGSCINSAAASLVGSAYCGSAWTSATGVGAGQFLIKGYSSSSITSRMALLVAGYEAADTTNAATYLRTQSVDTSKEYKGTSATQASLVVA